MEAQSSSNPLTKGVDIQQPAITRALDYLSIYLTASEEKEIKNNSTH